MNTLLVTSRKMRKDDRDTILHVLRYMNTALRSLMRYIQTLEDYGYELDEKWDNLLKTVEAKQSKPTEKKASYRV